MGTDTLVSHSAWEKLLLTYRPLPFCQAGPIPCICLPEGPPSSRRLSLHCNLLCEQWTVSVPSGGNREANGLR